MSWVPSESLLSVGGSFLLWGRGDGVCGMLGEGRETVSVCHCLVMELDCPFPMW